MVNREFLLHTSDIYEGGGTEWNAHHGYELIVRTFYCKALAGFITQELHEYLTDLFAGGTTAPERTTLGRA